MIDSLLNENHPDEPLSRRAGEAGSSEKISAERSKGSLVTPLAENSSVGPWHQLSFGVDTLDLGLYVHWGSYWSELSKQFDRGKANAAETKDGLLAANDSFIIHAGGKSGGYSWHLETNWGHVFIQNVNFPDDDTPNVICSFRAQATWSHALNQLLALATDFLGEFGGRVQSHKVSRVDLCTDFNIADGLTQEFLETHRVPEHYKSSTAKTGTELETFYHGSRKGSRLFRIYNKSVQLRGNHDKQWIKYFWEGETTFDVWRFELQLRRAYLRDINVDTVQQLSRLIPSIWDDATSKFLRLCLPDNANTSRRTIHPLWADVQKAVGESGDRNSVKREQRDIKGLADWYIQNTINKLITFAATMNISCVHQATATFADSLTKKLSPDEFFDRFKKERLRLGQSSHRKDSHDRESSAG